MNDKQQIDFTMDIDNLYREESIIDLKVGAIRYLVPVKADGTEDESREKKFMGQSQLMSPQGPVPLQALLKATTIKEAVEKFPKAMKLAMEAMMEKARRMQAMQGQGPGPMPNGQGIIKPGK